MIAATSLSFTNIYKGYNIGYTMENVMIIESVCKRCNHKWMPRGKKIFVCPRCRSPRWNEEEGIIRGDKNLSPDSVLDIIVNNPIFQEDLMIIGGIVRN